MREIMGLLVRKLGNWSSLGECRHCRLTCLWLNIEEESHKARKTLTKRKGLG